MKPRHIGAALALAATSACASAPLSEAERLEAAEAYHARSLVLDAHADIVIPSTSLSYLGADGLSKVSPEKMLAGGMDAVVMSVAVGPGPRDAEGRAAARAEADEKLAAARALADADDGVVLAIDAASIEAAHDAGQIAIILGFQNARALEGDVSALDEFYAAGVRVFALNHLGHNAFSDSSRPLYNGESGTYEPTAEHGGLSELGRAAIRRINALGGVVDISQMSSAAAIQALSLSTSPVIASHSNVRALSDVSRNLSDEEIDLIGARGGVIHVAPFGAYLVDLSAPEKLENIRRVRREAGLPEAYSYPYELYWELSDKADQRAFLMAMRSVIGAGDVSRMVDHIDYIKNRIGVDHVGIGTDFNHGSNIEGFEDASAAGNVTAELARRGYSEEEIAKIWSGNFLRVLRAAEAR